MGTFNGQETFIVACTEIVRSAYPQDLHTLREFTKIMLILARATKLQNTHAGTQSRPQQNRAKLLPSADYPTTGEPRAHT